MQPDAAYEQVKASINQVRGLTMALSALHDTATEVPVPTVASDALFVALSRALEDADSMLEAHYHPKA